MTKIKMLNDARSAVHGRLSAGQEYDVDPGLANYMIAYGDAVAVAVATPVAEPEPKAEKAAKPGSAKKPGPSANKRGKGPSENK